MPHSRGQNEVSLQAVIQVARRRIRVILASTLAVTALALAYAVWSPESYKTRALLAVETMNTGSFFKAPPAGGENVQDQLRVVREVLYSRPLLETIARAFQLYRGTGNQIPERSLEDLKSRITVQVEGTDTFYITYEGEGRQRVMDVTNRVTQLFIEQAAAMYARRAEEASGFIQTELERVAGVLSAQQEKIKQYSQSIAPQLPDHLASNLKMYETGMTRLQDTTEKIANEQARRAAVVHQLKELDKQGVGPSDAKSADQTALEQKRAQLQALQAKYTDLHPDVIAAKEELQELEKHPHAAAAGKSRMEGTPLQMRQLELSAEKEAIDERLQSYRKEHGALSSALGLYQKQVETAPRYQTTLASLMREYETTRTQYEGLLQKQQEARVAEHMEKANQGRVYRIVEPAPLPKAPLLPRRMRFVLLGMFTGLGLGILLALAREQLDSSFNNVEEFRGVIDLPVLTMIPSLTPVSVKMLPSAKAKRVTTLTISPNGHGLTPGDVPDSRPVTPINMFNPGSVASEQYNLLALHVRERLSSTHGQIVLVTSAAGGEGKTLTSVNLARSLAQISGGRVLLVDADLRKPGVQRYYPLKLGIGFSDLLVRPEDALEKYMCSVDGLSIIPGSAHRLIPMSVLSSKTIGAIFARFRKDFEYVVVDSPPLVPIADSHLLAKLSDGVLFVVRARKTARELLQRSLESLASAKLLGVVLNDVDLRSSPYAEAYDYYEGQYMSK